MALVERILTGFKPEVYGLSKEFILTKLTEMKGCGCKILLELLKSFGESIVIDNDTVGIGLDSCVIPLRHPGMNLVQTTDFFYPLVDDPYIMGRITCANVLSDLYAMGVSECDNMLMLLGVSVQMVDKERDIIVSMFIHGFKDAASLAGTKVRGGQTVRCPWLLLGGVATSVVRDDEMLRVDRARPGDVLILTKPLGGQVAVNSYEWIKKNNGNIVRYNLDESRIIRAFQQATEQMCRLNRNAAKLLRKHNAHASTDVTGFGILGHADNLARHQKEKVRFVIEKLPIIEYMDTVSKSMPNSNGFNLFSGTSAETSGGLLIAMPFEEALEYIEELEALDGFPSFIIGHVESSSGENQAILVEKLEVESIASTIY